jgi:predicted DsbA family dithiol-disulfide isomerase
LVVTRTLTIDVFSDIVCPWCFIGTQRLEKVLRDRGTEADITYRTFLLDPNTPPEGTNIPDMIRAKYGRDPAPMFARVEAEARNTGIELDLKKQPMSYPTIRAHTLLRHAAPLGTQRALNAALFKAHFLDAQNIHDPAVLVPLAVTHGFTEARATELLTDDKERAITLVESDVPKKLGISGAPFFIFDQTLAVSGAQPVDIFGQVIDEALARE